ncbi:glycerol kinase GlpK [soil metagenome]
MGTYLGVDHGGSTTTALLVADDGRILGRGTVAMPRYTPSAGWVEHDPDDFTTGTIGCAAMALEAAGLRWRDVDAVGIANQGETSIAWDSRTGRPVGPALSWQDRRTDEACRALVEAGDDDLVRAISGLSIDPYFSASKFAWLMGCSDEATSALTANALRLGGSDAFVIASLCRHSEHCTDASTASRTALLDLDAVRWSPQLLDVFGVPKDCLPAITPTTYPFGIIHHPLIAKRIPITANVVDSHAAQFMHEAWAPGAVKASFGTGAFIETSVGPTAIRSARGLTPFIGWDVQGDLRYVLEGGVFDVGAALDWLVTVGLAESASQTAELASRVTDSGGVRFVPAFSGLGAPTWNSRARGSLSGLSLESSAAHIIRAMLHGIAMGVCSIVDLLGRDAGRPISGLRADGGPSANPMLMQMHADLLGISVSVVDEPDVTAFGAAFLAGVGDGSFTASDLPHFSPPVTEYEPQQSSDWRGAQWAQWTDLLSAVQAPALLAGCQSP